MPNVRISDLPPASLPLSGAELLELTQGGFSRNSTVDDLVSALPALSATFLTLTASPSLPNERILMAGVGISFVDGGAGGPLTISAMGLGGQVDSVVGGANVSVDATDPVNPVVNLDVALVGISVNGVTLSDAGAAANYLDETGNYSVPAGGGGGGQVNVVVGGVNITVDATDPVNPLINLDAALVGISVNGVTLSDAGVATNFLDETGNYSVPPGGGVQISGTPSNNQLAVWVNGTTIEGESELTYNGGNNRLTLAASQASMRLDETDGGGDCGYYLTSTTTGNFGGVLLFDSFAGNGLTLRQTSDSGTLQDIWINMFANGAVDLYHNGIRMAVTATSANGGFRVNNTATGGGFERVLTTSDLSSVVATVDEDVDSSTVLQNDNALFFLGLPVGRYRVEALIIYSELTASGQGIGYELDMTTGVGSGTFISVVPATTVNIGVGDSGVHPLGSAVEISLNANTTIRGIHITGVLSVAASGDFRFRFAQSSSSANAVRRLAGSYMVLSRLN